MGKSGKKLKAEIHCPVSGCLYSVGSERHFSEKKFLNQHIAKVHAEKKYACTKCKMCFGLDWWRRHHEKTCGVEWECSCGIKYGSRETLLTHARRNQHKLPENVLSTDKGKNRKMNNKTADNPTIVIIQPIIQNFTCIQPLQAPSVNLRPILPKATQPFLFTLPMAVNSIPNLSNSNTICSPVITSLPLEESLGKNQSVAESDVLSNTDSFLHSPQCLNEGLEHERNDFQKTIATQTVPNPVKSRQSQASQCTRRAAKSKKTMIESTHTQTAESVVVKIKKKRSRRKSVAITTEPSLLRDHNLNTDLSFWPGIKDFFASETFGACAYKKYASKQTSTHKSVCDSETITDEGLLKFQWEDVGKEKSSSSFETLVSGDHISVLPKNYDSNDLPMFCNDTSKEKSCSSYETLSEDVLPKRYDPNDLFCNDSRKEKSSFETISEIVSDDRLSVLPKNYDPNALSMFCSNTIMKTSFPESAKELEGKNKDLECISENKSSENSSNSLMSVFSSVKENASNKISQPTLSDIHTQTILSAVLDNVLANMETQTTDDFTLSDLEFSDTETQTPWNDFPNIDSPQSDRDIEIQTDFSSFAQELNEDPYDFINGMDVPNMIGGCSSKECIVANNETQTQGKFSFPQFTNTESQTLDIPDFVFE